MTPELLIQLALGAAGVGLIALPIVLWMRGARRRRSRETTTLPPGWTDDMRVELPPGRTVEELVGFVIDNALRAVPDEQTERELVEKFALSPDAAALARDRV